MFTRALESAHAREVAALREEIAFLRAQVERLTEHHVRIERAERGLHETEPAKKPKPETMPGTLERLVNLFSSAAARKELRTSIAKARQMDPPKTWEEIEREIRASVPPEALVTFDAQEELRHASDAD